ncbi:hypothetical protein I4U23_002818 [Adineta vaga]|nr:hypothetical protein I4U23_002818 [Adineta vaga]
MKHIEENTEFEIDDSSEVEYTPSEGERTSHDYVLAPKKKQPTFLQLILPGVIEEEELIRNRVVRALYCTSKSGVRKRHFLLEVNEQPCEIRPIASEGSTELRYLHSTQNLYDYMLTYGNDTILYVKLLRGDPPIKAIEFDGYMVLKSTLNGDKVPICRVEDLEVTLISPDFPLRVRLPTRNEHSWHSLSEVRAAEVQCMQLALALLARHESEMYVSIDAKQNKTNHSQSTYNQEQRSHRSRQSTDIRKRHVEECEKVFGVHSNQMSTKSRTTSDNNSDSSSLIGAQMKTLTLSKRNSHTHHESSSRSRPHSSHPTSDRLYRTFENRPTDQEQIDETDSYNQSHRPTVRHSSNNPKTKINRS